MGKAKKTPARRALEWTFTAAVLAGLAYLVFVMGFRAYPVLSDSMEPLVQRGDMVLYVNPDTSPPSQGDVIVFTPNLDADTTLPVVHRWVDTAPDGTIITQGDNNDRRDPWRTTAADVNGVVIGYLPLHNLRNSWTIPVAGAVLGFVIITYILMAFTGRKENKEENLVADAYMSPRRIVKHQKESARTTAIRAEKKQKQRTPEPPPLDWYSGGEDIPNSPPRYPWLEPAVKIVKPATVNETNIFIDILNNPQPPKPVRPRRTVHQNVTLPPEPADIYWAKPDGLPKRPQRNT